MSDIQIGIFSIFGILFLISAGMHVALALTLLSFLGVALIKGNWALASILLGQAAGDSVSDYIYGVIPLFVLMGMLVSVSGMGKDTFDVAHHLFKRIRGGLGIATVVGNAIFAAVTGVSIASAAVFTKVAVPEMIRLGYKPRFAVGVVTGSSVLGMLIPPSLLLILFGVLTETSIGDLFKAGIGPGLLLAVAYCIAIFIMAFRYPDYVGGQQYNETCDMTMTVTQCFLKLGPISLLICLVLGGIYAGWFTPTESGAAGAFGALLIALSKRKLNWQRFWEVLLETGNVTVSILFLFIAANMYGRMLALSGLPEFVATVITQSGMGLYTVMWFYLVALLLMGMILDSASIMMIAVPLMYPIMKTIGVDFIWWGILTLIAIEVGLLTPPLGMSAFVVKSSLDDQRISIVDIFIGSFPYVCIMLLILGLIVIFPQIALVFV